MIIRKIRHKLGICKKYIKLKLLYAKRLLTQKKFGLNLIGFFSYTFGVAEIGRFFAQHLINTGIPFQIFDIESKYNTPLDNSSLKLLAPYYSKQPSFDKNIFFVNADTVNSVEYKYPELFTGRYNAAVFFWEFNDYFNFPQAFKVLDEVIVFTGFVATSVRKVAPPHIKVTHLPIPFIRSWQITKTNEQIRNSLDIRLDEFVFIFNFDFNSVYNRKNPEALLKAFELAFTENDNVRLIFKTIHAEQKNKDFQRFITLRDQMGFKNKIIIVNSNLDRNEFMSMISASDCYISLHRSEGLGLGMMEAMSMGKAVIATRYGGNTDFMNEENSLLLNYTLVPVEPGSEPYKPGWLWADADVRQAALYMKQLYNNRAEAESLGKKAQDYIEKNYNGQAFVDALYKWMCTKEN